jgi:hypothetical protein
MQSDGHFDSCTSLPEKPKLHERYGLNKIPHAASLPPLCPVLKSAKDPEFRVERGTLKNIGDWPGISATIE